jgi:predicted nucleic acid-binding protein
MTAVLIDTNVYCGAMRGDSDAVALWRTAARILMSPIVVGELQSGFRGGGLARRNADQLRRFLAQERVEALSVTSRTAEFYALVLHQLREDGAPIPTNDIWIAASALEHGAGLATRDKHFQKVKGLLLPAW